MIKQYMPIVSVTSYECQAKRFSCISGPIMLQDVFYKIITNLFVGHVIHNSTLILNYNIFYIHLI